MKILIFIDNEKIEHFFELIKRQYYKNNKKFLDYFEKQYFKTGLFKDNNWNFSSFLKGEEDTQLYFYTNNVAETLNRTINNFYKNSRKTFYNFQNCINKIIELYDNHTDYIEKNISITRVLAWYYKNCNIDELKTENDYVEIIDIYKKHMNYDINQSDIDDIDESDENIKNKESFSSSNYSSNYYSSSSSDSSNNIKNGIGFNKNNDNDKDNSSSEDNNNNQNNQNDNKNNKNLG